MVVANEELTVKEFYTANDPLRFSRIPVYKSRVDYPLGSPQKPMSFDDCTRKFKNCASYPASKLSDDQVERVVELTEQMERLDDVGEIMRLLTIK